MILVYLVKVILLCDYFTNLDFYFYSNLLKIIILVFNYHNLFLNWGFVVYEDIIAYFKFIVNLIIMVENTIIKMKEFN
jgi:hypothetical protein